MEEKRKQKAGLNAIRPDDFTENEFKEMAKSKGLSQTQLFEKIFYSFLRDERKEKQENMLPLESEINLISGNLSSILEHFKSIASKSQDTIITLKNNSEQIEINLNTELDTLKKKIEELEYRNTELEKTNSIFTEIKEDLEKKISELQGSNDLKNAEVDDMKKSLKKKDEIINELNTDLIKSNKELKEIKEDNDNKNIKIKNLEVSKSSLEDTLKTLEDLKKAEISSVELKYKNKISELEDFIKVADTDKENSLKNLEKSLKLEFEANKKLAIAEMTLNVAKTTSNYNAVVEELMTFKLRYSEIKKELMELKTIKDRNN